MFGDKPPEVLIAGAGPVGLFTALELARRGVAVRIVDTGVWACTHSYALALQPQSLPLFEELGLLDRVMHNCYRVNTVALADSSGARMRIALDTDDPKSCLAVLRQDVLEGLLERALGEHGVHVDWRREVSRLEPVADGVRAGIDHFEKESRGYIIAHTEWVVAGSAAVEVPYVIGADGYNSRVRRALNYDFPEVGRGAILRRFRVQHRRRFAERNDRRAGREDGRRAVAAAGWGLPLELPAARLLRSANRRYQGCSGQLRLRPFPHRATQGPGLPQRGPPRSAAQRREPAAADQRARAVVQGQNRRRQVAHHRALRAAPFDGLRPRAGCGWPATPRTSPGQWASRA